MDVFTSSKGTELRISTVTMLYNVQFIRDIRTSFLAADINIDKRETPTNSY